MGPSQRLVSSRWHFTSLAIETYAALLPQRSEILGSAKVGAGSSSSELKADQVLCILAIKGS